MLPTREKRPESDELTQKEAWRGQVLYIQYKRTLQGMTQVTSPTPFLASPAHGELENASLGGLDTVDLSSERDLVTSSYGIPL